MKKTFKLCIAALFAAFALNSCEDVPAPYNPPTADDEGTGSTEVVTPAGTGTATDPYNVAAAIQLISAMDADVNSDEIYVKGKIVEIKEVDPSFGNATYYIADTETSTKLYIFRSKYLGNKNFTATDQIKVGDEVVIRGQFVNYKGNTPETVTNKSYLVSINGSGDAPDTPIAEPKGDGSEANPYNVAALLTNFTDPDNLPSETIYVKGKISQIRSIDVSKYTRAQYFISDDGTTANQFYIYNGNYLNGADFTSNDQIKEGDEVVICGVLGSYNGSVQMAQGSKIVSINGSTEPSEPSEPEEPDTPDTPAVDGISVSGTVVTLCNGSVTAGSESVAIDLNSFGYANAQDVTVVESNGCTITFGSGDNKTNAPKFYEKTKGVRMYANNVVSFTAEKPIATVVLQCDALSGTNYVGNDPMTLEIADNVFTLTNTYAAASGGTQLRIQKVTVTYAE